MVFGLFFERNNSDITTEQDFLLKEISVLDDFNKDIEEISKLRKEITELKELPKSNNSSIFFSNLHQKIKALDNLIHKDVGKFSKFCRRTSRSERRRIRDEEKVLKKLTVIDQELSGDSKDNFDKLLNEVHIFSNRILTELSWRVGKLVKLSKEENPNIDEIKKHIDATKEAATALIALLGELDKSTSSLKKLIKTNGLIHQILPKTAGLNDYVKRGIILTAVIKSIPSLKHSFERNFSIGRSRIIEKNKVMLLRVLTPQQLEDLKNYYEKVPEECIMLFIPPGVTYGNILLLYNPYNLSLFIFPGWIFHATSSLKQKAKTGLLSDPLERLLTRRTVVGKFWKSTSPHRLTSGISFAFQDVKEYLGYAQGGGFFIFPINKVLRKDLILDFAHTMDGWPEIILTKTSFRNLNSGFILRDCLIFLNQQAIIWMNNYKEMKKSFDYLKKEKTNNVMDIKLSNEEVQTVQDFLNNNNFIDFSFWYIDFLQLKRKLNLESVKEKPKGSFIFGASRELPWMEHGKGLRPLTSLLKTIFANYSGFLDIDEYNRTHKNFVVNFSMVFLTLTLMKTKPQLSALGSPEDYFGFIKKMSPKEVFKLFNETKKQILKAMDEIIKGNYQKDSPVTIPIKEGILFVSKDYSDYGMLGKLTKQGVPIFPVIDFQYVNRTKSQPEMDFIFKEILRVNDLQGIKSYYRNKSYFFLKGKQVMLHDRENDLDVQIT